MNHESPLVDSAAAFLLLRTLVLVIAVELCVLVLFAGATTVSDRILGRAVIVLVMAIVLFPTLQGAWKRGPELVLLWSVLSALVLLLGTMVFDPGVTFTSKVFLLAGGTSLLVGLFVSLKMGLAQWRGDRRTASRDVLAYLLLSLTLPLWLSPLVIVFSTSKWLVDTIVALCPVSFLAALAGIDYLRSDWFYRHAPYGGLRYDYPDPAVVGLAILFTLSILWFWHRSRNSPPFDYSSSVELKS